MKKFPLGLILFSAVAQAQPHIAPRANPSEPRSESKQVTFYSDRIWQAARWYIVGSLRESGAIAWADGSRSRIQWNRAKCPVNQLSAASVDVEIRPEKFSTRDMEILRAPGWVAIEVSPVVIQENFGVRVLSSTGEPLCEGRLDLHYGWNSGGGLRPMLFVSPRNNKYFGYSFSVESDEVEARADIQLDLLLGASQASFPNAAVGAKKTMNSVPIAVARAEWLLPFFPKMGVLGSLSQTVASFGGIADQNALYSDWSMGFFYQKFFAIKDSLQVRGSLHYYQHLGDDNHDIPTFAPPNKDAQFLVVGILSNLYFAKRWMVGVDFNYGPANKLSGRGATQKFMEAGLNFGLRVTSSMFLLGEFQRRTYSATGYQSEAQNTVQGGIRLEL